MKIKKIIGLAVAITLLTGCIEEPKFSKKEQQIALPFDNQSYFSEAFKKLNSLLIAFNAPIYRVQVKTIENLTSAKNAMPMDSSSFIKTPIILNMNHIKLVAYEPIFNKYETKTTGFVYFPEMKKSIPQLVINGGVTQFDKGIISTSDNFDIDAEFGGGDWRTDARFNHDNSDSFSQIALDLSIFRYKDRTYLSGVASKNKIEIHRKRKKNRFGMFLNGSGIGYSKYATLQQSKDEALRILSEYSLIQLLGRLYNIPYWKCTTPNMKPDEYIVNRAINQFVSSKKEQKLKLIEQFIRFYGYNSKIDGKISKQELLILSIISKKYNFKSKKILTTNFYKELYLNAPFFKENMKRDEDNNSTTQPS